MQHHFYCYSEQLTVAFIIKSKILNINFNAFLFKRLITVEIDGTIASKIKHNKSIWRGKPGMLYLKKHFQCRWFCYNFF